ncbi:hypothetical protein SAMN05421827_10459 [Pedobacter terrae]|uniref:Uncharacterized protein n=1 Tax=Pedobacter terrae TaxID=405671 RepID=A0A1G7S6F4_9SPHI|nr:hypothetical protein [Pedobacter terrae]SDG18578.1 hypothetical protein SAMN05421827_10459 [Pedobacter terrae]
MEQLKPENIDQYIANFPAEMQNCCNKSAKLSVKPIRIKRSNQLWYASLKQHKVLVYLSVYQTYRFLSLVLESRLLRVILPIINGVSAFKLLLNEPLDLITRITKIKVE